MAKINAMGARAAQKRDFSSSINVALVLFLGAGVVLRSLLFYLVSSCPSLVRFFSCYSESSLYSSLSSRSNILNFQFSQKYSRLRTAKWIRL